jgi:hypothetical protein
MTRARPFLLLPLLLAVAACQTQRKPLTGFDTPPPGIILNGENRVLLWPIFDLPQETQIFRPRLNGQDAIVVTSDEGYYDYAKSYLQGWTGGWEQWLSGIPSGTYTVGLTDSAGQSWGQSAPLLISSGPGFSTPSTTSPQIPAVLFTHFDGQAGAWTIDPTTQDSDPATDEITMTNLVDEAVVVERCLIAAAGRTSCTPVGTVAPGADLLTVETVASSSMGDHQALFIHLASDASQSYQRDLVQGSGTSGSGCQIERILVHGRRLSLSGGLTAFAMSSCYGYASGGS